MTAEWQMSELGEKGDYFIEGQNYNYRYYTSAVKHKNEYGRHLISIYAYDNLDGYATADTDFAIASQSFLMEMEVSSMEKRQSRRADIMGHPMGKCQTPYRRTSFS